LERRVEARTREIERMGEANRRAAITRERLRIARDLYSTLAHSLLALLSQIRLARKLAQRDPAEVEAELARAEEAARKGLARARAAVGELRFQALGEEGLGPALERLTTRLRDKTSLKIRLHVDPAAAGLADEQAEVLYRIAEEAVRNVERHSAAEHVDVNVRVDRLNEAERLTLTVADNGVGFDPRAARSGHYGLTGMREQAKLIGAELCVDSAPGQGTRLSVSFPS
jgi:signal transduction histidine kinase